MDNTLLLQGAHSKILFVAFQLILEENSFRRCFHFQVNTNTLTVFYRYDGGQTK